MHKAGGSLDSSLTDLVTSLMVIFILLLVNFLHIEQGKQESTINNVEALAKELSNIVREVNAQGQQTAEVKIDPTDPLTLLVIIPTLDRKLFAEGESAPQPVLLDYLAAFGPKLIGIVSAPSWNDKIRSLVIEGHTDKRPYQDEYGNLKLSQDRSRQILQKLLTSAAEHHETTRELVWKIASASGRADRDCDAQDESEGEQQKCRRVEFKIRVKSEVEKDLKKALPSAGKPIDTNAAS